MSTNGTNGTNGTNASSGKVTLDVDVNALRLEQVRRSYAIWNDLVSAMMRAHDELKQLGEYEQAQAMLVDALAINNRAALHVRQLCARHLGAANSKEELTQPGFRARSEPPPPPPPRRPHSEPPPHAA